MPYNPCPRRATHSAYPTIASVLLNSCTTLAGESFEGYALQPDDVTTVVTSAESDAGDASPSVPDEADNAAVAYAVEERRLTSGGIERAFLVARPNPMPDGPLPLVLSFHGERDTLENSSEGIRRGLPLEQEAAGAAVFVYPRAPNSAQGWPFFTDVGRARETVFIADVIAALGTELGIDGGTYF